MAKFRMQVKIKLWGQADEWRDVTPSISSKPYEYDTELEAHKMRQIYYSGCIYGEEVRVREVE